MRAAAVLLLALTAAAPRSGYEDSGPATRAMQDHDSENPGFLWVEQGAALWAEGCSGCHGDVASMKGVAARYPAWDSSRGRAVSLPQRINLCVTEHQGRPALPAENDNMLALSALIGLQSRGVPLAIDETGPMQSVIAEGRVLHQTPMGQLNLSCAQCHDQLAGKRLAGSLIPQGHANGYPQYRLEWQTMGSFARRLRNCMTGVRAEPFAADSAEMVAIEAYLAVRAKGLNVETPAVRP